MDDDDHDVNNDPLPRRRRTTTTTTEEEEEEKRRGRRPLNAESETLFVSLSWDILTTHYSVILYTNHAGKSLDDDDVNNDRGGGGRRRGRRRRRECGTTVVPKKEDQPVVFPVVDTNASARCWKSFASKLATKVKLRWIDGDDAQKEKATSGVAATLVALEREFGVKRDGEEVGKCVEDAETLATKTKKKKKKRKIDDGGGFDDAEEAEKRRTRRKTRIQTTTTTTRGSMFDDDKRAMDAFHRLAKGILAEEEEGDSRVRDGTELGRSAKDVARRACTDSIASARVPLSGLWRQ